MKTFYFHIGSERCGSTFVQSVFNAPEVIEALTGFSIRFDIEIYSALGKLLPVPGLNEARMVAIRDRYLTPHKSADHNAVFTTQELMLGIVHEYGQPNRCKAMCARIKILGEGFDIRPIIVLRRQNTFLGSPYNQFLKHGETRDFMTFVHALPLDNYHWHDVVETYIKNFGADKVTVVPFEKKVLETADRVNFIEGIFMALGLDIKVDISNLPIKNPSLSERAMEIQRLANQLLSREEAQALAAHFVDNIPKLPSERYGLFPEGARKRLLDRYRESNQWLFTTHLSAHDSTYYVNS